LVKTEQLASIRQHIQGLTVEKSILSYITQISNATRDASELFLGGSPRASVALLQAAKVQASLAGRECVTPDDVKSVVAPVYRHRIILKPEATLEGLDADGVLSRILSSVEVPR
jgi:MoxR-like ATPase